jgi:hypothetical protein
MSRKVYCCSSFMSESVFEGNAQSTPHANPPTSPTGAVCSVNQKAPIILLLDVSELDVSRQVICD